MEVFTMRSLDIEYSSVIFWSVEWIGRIQRYFCYIQYMAASTGGLKKLDSQSEISGSHAIDISTHQCIQRFLCVIHQVCKNKCKNCPHRLEDRVENEWKQQTQVLEYLTESIWRRCETASPAWLAARRFIPAAELWRWQIIQASSSRQFIKPVRSSQHLRQAGRQFRGRQAGVRTHDQKFSQPRPMFCTNNVLDTQTSSVAKMDTNRDFFKSCIHQIIHFKFISDP